MAVSGTWCAACAKCAGVAFPSGIIQRDNAETMESVLHRTHITAATFWGSYVLLGEGNGVSAYSLQTLDDVGQHTVFPNCNVHGIVPAQENPVKCLCAVHGSKYITVLQIGATGDGQIVFDPVLPAPIHLGDWVWDVRWVKDGKIAACLGHNRVLLWSHTTQEPVEDRQCIDRCILYCAHLIGSTWDTLVAAVGTVFKEVLLWAPSQATLLHRLTGHQGVIFSINYNAQLRLLCSTSDDRSLRVFAFRGPCCAAREDMSPAEWIRGQFTCIHTLYGHASRVWRAVCLEACYISVGEDSYLCVWSRSGDLIYKMTSPGEGSTWCLAVNKKESLVLTGSRGSALSLWHIPDILSQASCTVLLRDYQEMHDFPKNLALVRACGTSMLVVATNEGGLHSRKLGDQEYTHVLPREQSLPYSVLSASPCGKYLAAGTRDGRLLIFKVQGTLLSLHVESDVHTGKVHSVEWIAQDPPTVLSSGLHGNTVLSKICQTDKRAAYQLESCAGFILPWGKQRWVTAAVLLPSADLLVAGDRLGSIHVYCCPKSSGRYEQLESQGRFPGIHGCDGVMHLVASAPGLLSTGRDGRVLLFAACPARGLQLLRTFWWSTELEWIGRLYPHGDDLLVAGYHMTDFVLWSTKQQREVLRLNCGGGHRPWHFVLEPSGEAVFACIKKRDVLVHRCNLLNVLYKSCLKFPVHKRKICAVCVLSTQEDSSGGSQSCIATAGEDNIIVISLLRLELEHACVRVVCRLYGHISSVKAMAWTRMSDKPPDHRLLASAGGRAQLILWSLPASEECDTAAEELGSHLLWTMDGAQRKDRRDADGPLARYMGVSVWESAPQQFFVATAGSDAVLRIFGYTSQAGLQILKSIETGEHCLLRGLRAAVAGGHSLLLTGGNDGMLRCFLLTSSLQCVVLDAFQRHQSGINALDVSPMQDDRMLILSGGDDTSLAVTLVALTKEQNIIKLQEAVVHSAHTAQISGVKIVSNCCMLSAGIDQRLRVWSFVGGVLEMDCSRISCIPDIACCAWWSSDTGLLFLICGEGLELCRYTLGRPP